MTWKNKAAIACAFAFLLTGMGETMARAVTDDDLTEIKQLIKQLEDRHAEDEKHIKDLEQRLEVFETNIKATNAASSASQAPTTSVSVPIAVQPPATASAFNPEVGVTLMGTYAHFGRNPNNVSISGFMLGDEAKKSGDQGFSLGESEISLSGNIDHTLYGQLILSHPRDGGVDVEEGFIQTTTLPWGLTIKAGRFFSGIGYLNEQHQHAWDFLDAPLPYRAMLNNQLGDEGVQFRWTAPTEIFLQFGMEGLRGDKFPATPTHDGMGAQSIFIKAGDDVNESNSWLASTAYYHADASNLVMDTDTFTGANHLGIAGIVWKWAPNGNPVQQNLKLQSEFFLRRQDGTFNNLAYKGNQTGLYGQAIYQFMPRWSVGTRYDRISASDTSSIFAGTVLDNTGYVPQRYSGILMYDTSEFGRFRLQYNYDESTRQSNQGVMMNYTISIGAHGAHQY